MGVERQSPEVDGSGEQSQGRDNSLRSHEGFERGNVLAHEPDSKGKQNAAHEAVDVQVLAITDFERSLA